MKKIIVFMTCLCMLTNIIFAEESPSETTTSTQVFKIAEKLDALGIVSASTLQLDDTVTRGAYARIMVALMGCLPYCEAEPQTTAFLDVPITSPNCGTINMLYDMGYISGVGERKFLPDDPMTGIAATKILVGILGYDREAQRNGGYPAGYRFVASKLRLYQSSQTEMSYRDVILLLDSALTVEVLMQEGLNPNLKYKHINGGTLLEVYHNVYTDRGIVSETYGSNLAGGETYHANDRILIDNQVFSCMDTYSHLLGKDVFYYYSEDKDGERSIIYLEPTSKNKECTVSIDALQNMTSDCLFYYGEDGKVLKENISTDMDVIYNDRAYSTYGSAQKLYQKIKNMQGDIRLLDNNDDSIYDVVFIYVCTDYVVDAVDQKDYVLTDSQGTKISVDPSENDITYIHESGEQASLLDVTSGTVISVYESINSGKKRIKIYIANNTVEGKVIEYSAQESGNGIYRIGEAWYQVSPELKVSFSVGDTGVFHLNHRGRIVDYQYKENDAYLYGVLIGTDRTKGLDKDILLKIFNENGSFETLKIEQDIKLNGKPAEKETIYAAVEMTDVSSEYPMGKAKIIRYSMGTNNTICALELPADEGTETDGLRTLKSGYRFFTRNNIWTTNLGDTSGYCVTPDNTKMFMVPKDLSKEEQFDVVNYANLRQGYNEVYDYVAYGMGIEEIPKCSAVLIYNYSTGIITEKTIPTVVTKVTTVMDEQGDIVKQIEGVSGMQYVKATFEEGDTFAGVSMDQIIPGDILRLGKNINGNVIGCELILRKDRTAQNGAKLYTVTDAEHPTAVYSTGGINKYDRCVFAQVVGRSDRYVELSTGEEDGIIIRIDSCPVVGYSEMNNTYRMLTADAVAKGDWVLVFSSYQLAQCVIVND